MIRIANKSIGDGQPVYIIAEMACAHDGEISKAKRLVESAVNGGADAIQLQFFVPDQIVTLDNDIFELLQKIQFSEIEWREIYEYARTFDIEVFACTYDVESAKMAIDFGVDGIKLNSADLSNPDLLEVVANSNIPFTLGTGASTFEEVAEAIQFCNRHNAWKIIIMHGVQNFPTDVENANIAKMKMFKGTFPFPVGYQDHTDASDKFSQVIDLLAIGMGANVIEKHITLDRSERGTDYQAALEPVEFSQFVETIRLAESAIGSSCLQPLSENDRTYRNFQKKSIVAKRSLPKGHTLTESDVLYLRANKEGMSPKEMKSIRGCKLNRDIAKNTVLETSFFID